MIFWENVVKNVITQTFCMNETQIISHEKHPFVMVNIKSTKVAIHVTIRVYQTVIIVDPSIIRNRLVSVCHQTRQW